MYWPSRVTAPTPVCTVVGLKMTVDQLWTGDFVVGVGENPSYWVTIEGIQNPLEADSMDALQVRFVEPGGGVLMSVMTDYGDPFDIGVGTMLCSITASPTTVDYDKSKMLITITPTKQFPTDTTFTINLPRAWPRITMNTSYNQVINTTSQPSCLPITPNIQSNIACSISPSTAMVTASNLFAATVSQQITFSLSQIRNPPTTEQQGSIEITSVRANGKSMEKCSGVKMTGITAGELSAVSFNVDSREVGG